LLRLFDNPVARLALALPLALTDTLGLGSEMMIVAQPGMGGQDAEEMPT